MVLREITKKVTKEEEGGKAYGIDSVKFIDFYYSIKELETLQNLDRFLGNPLYTKALGAAVKNKGGDEKAQDHILSRLKSLLEKAEAVQDKGFGGPDSLADSLATGKNAVWNLKMPGADHIMSEKDVVLYLMAKE